jgi:hypothetical protein
MVERVNPYSIGGGGKAGSLGSAFFISEEYFL